MQRIYRLLLLITLLLITVSCGGTKSSRSESSKAQTRFDFGRSTRVEFLRSVISSTLRKYNYDLQHLENLIETEWVLLPPNESEQMQGIKAIRYKLVVLLRARRKLSTASLRLNYEARYGSNSWVDGNPSPEVVDAIAIMRDEVRQELNRDIPQW